jgi:hypothetical protein
MQIFIDVIQAVLDLLLLGMLGYAGISITVFWFVNWISNLLKKK